MSVPQELRLDQESFTKTVQLVKDVVRSLPVLPNSPTSKTFRARILKVISPPTMSTTPISPIHTTTGILRGFHRYGASRIAVLFPDIRRESDFISEPVGDDKDQSEASRGIVPGNRLLLAREREPALSVELQTTERFGASQRLFAADYPCPFSHRCEGRVR